MGSDLQTRPMAANSTGRLGKAVRNHTHTRNNYNFRICDCGVSRSDS